jgi:DNA mismatch repair protein MutS
MTVTPMMSQWHACKEKAPGSILLFRLGDFYEAFEEDAVVLAKELDIVLTKRQETPMAGIPVHTCEAYIDRLVGRGYRVAIAEQLEDPKNVKGIVKREVVRLITPGSVIQSTLLNEKANNFMICVTERGACYGLAIIDVTTADFRVMEFENQRELLDEIERLSPKEVIVSEKCWKGLKEFVEITSVVIKEAWCFEYSIAIDVLQRHFHMVSFDGFGLKEMDLALTAAGILLMYIKDELNMQSSHIKTITPQYNSAYMMVDKTTQRHLEIVEPIQNKGKSLLSIIDETVTPMGGRLLKKWLSHPLLSVEEIQERQRHVEKFFYQDAIKKNLKDVRDLERLCMRIETGYAMPRDLVSLRFSLEPLLAISAALEKLLLPPLPDCNAVVKKIALALVDTPPLRLGDGGIFKDGYNDLLDELKTLKADSQAWLAQYQTTLRSETQIKTLKVGYTQAFGFYIEVSRGQADKVPISFQRRQTLVNTERFISPELKEFEHKILTAEERILFLEKQLFEELRQEIVLYRDIIRTAASQIAEIDVFCSFARIAVERKYVKPSIHSGYDLMIEDGRHPVIETTLNTSHFIPNTAYFDEKQTLCLITGPNMAGKSTFIRQIALIVLMAQIGSFVPAQLATIPIVDKLFTRIGASDDLSRGQSTFMVEMNETANILNNATPRSLVVLDEIGRGTSTYDGIAIAWAVAEHLLLQKLCKTLFATHYYELTQLEKFFPKVVNYHVAVCEQKKQITFLRKIVRGSTDKSYGIHVAKLAGLPNSVVERAEQMLTRLHQKE